MTVCLSMFKACPCLDEFPSLESSLPMPLAPEAFLFLSAVAESGSIFQLNVEDFQDLTVVFRFWQTLSYTQCTKGILNKITTKGERGSK